eukprot:TRINITY_DN6971_c0_g1_i2.p1 TRINITY_DN6971_c0_g1~~TRINITY_DN6971_c0_g1_i2.p1  ORF type:complete len:1461 (+),score=315.10 TRINITY_DN6971_c0_g1_i2:205-4587(+)
MSWFRSSARKQDESTEVPKLSMDNVASIGGADSNASTGTASSRPFEWSRFFELIRPDLEGEHGYDQQTMSSTSADNEKGAACAVIDAGSHEEACLRYVSASFAKCLGCARERAVGKTLDGVLLPDDKVLNSRINGEELRRLDALAAASASAAPNHIPTSPGSREARIDSSVDTELDVLSEAPLVPIVCFLLMERRSGERFWGVLRVGQAVLDGHPYVFLLLETVNMPKLEVLEGVRPTLEVRARVEEMLAGVRLQLETEGGNVNVETLARNVESTVSAWVKGGQSGAENEIEQRAPQNGLKAAEDFEAKEIWSKLLRESELKMIDNTDSTAWTVADASAEDVPLVYVSRQFVEFTGYTAAWMLGRNCRFLQPNNPGRNDTFNGEERRRMRTFCKSGSGSMASLVLNQKADGSFFWNLIIMEHVSAMGKSYILAANKQLTMHQELLSMMNTWDHRSLGYITSLRMLIKNDEPHLSPSPARLMANESVIAEIFAEWSESIRQDLSNFWEGDHFVPPVGGQAVRAFEGTWAPLMDVAEQSIIRIHGIRDQTMRNVRDNTSGGIVCAVADPSGPDCPLVFVSKEFENMTGYRWDFAMGRNCRFLQPNNRKFNMHLNGDEVARMRHFCTELQDFAVGSNILNLLLNEKRTGERFWNLLHMTHVDVMGRRYILGVQTTLDLPMPSFLAAGAQESTPEVLDLCCFLAKLRGRLQCMAESADATVTELTKNMLNEILEYMKSVTDDYEGDHYVPKRGLAQAKQFELEQKWCRVFREVATDMQAIYENTEETYKNTEMDTKGSACCTVVDPQAEDCALVYISHGFEDLTGYHRDWALGRNCRFLQPNARAYNDAFNVRERGQLREFCKLPAKKGRLLSVLVNENRDGYPFWNALLCKHIDVGDQPYIFGVQTNIYRHRGLLCELLAGGPDAFQELGRLRAIMRSREAKLGTYSMATLIDESLQQWLTGVQAFMRPATIQVSSGALVPMLGLELARNEKSAMEDKLLGAIDEGIRHFHLNLAQKRGSDTADLEGRLFALRLVEALAIIKQRHLHYLRDSLVFSLRALPSQLAGVQEIIRFLTTAGFNVCLWLLDVNNATPDEIQQAWPSMDSAVRHGLVRALGVHGGGPSELAAANAGRDSVRPTVQALDMYVGAPFTCRQWVHISKICAQTGMVLMTTKPFGVKGALLSNSMVRNLAKEKNIDPAMFLLKWAEGVGYACITPTLRTKSGPALMSVHDDPNIIHGTHRAFVREYAAGPAAAVILQAIKRKFPGAGLDQVKMPASAKGADGGHAAPPPARRSTGGGAGSAAMAAAMRGGRQGPMTPVGSSKITASRIGPRESATTPHRTATPLSPRSPSSLRSPTSPPLSPSMSSRGLSPKPAGARRSPFSSSMTQSQRNLLGEDGSPASGSELQQRQKELELREADLAQREQLLGQRLVEAERRLTEVEQRRQAPPARKPAPEAERRWRR